MIRSFSAEQGTALEVGKLDGLQKRIPATVVRFPFYDADKTRPRGVAGVRLQPDPGVGFARENLKPRSG